MRSVTTGRQRAWLLAVVVTTLLAGCRWKAERSWACRDGLAVEEVADVPGDWRWAAIADLPSLSDGSRYVAQTDTWQHHHFASAPPRVTVRRVAADETELARGVTYLHQFGQIRGWRLDGDDLFLRAQSRDSGEFRRFSPRAGCDFDRPGRCDPRERARDADTEHQEYEGWTWDIPPGLGPELPAASELGVEGVVCTVAEAPDQSHWMATATYTEVFLYRVIDGDIEPLSQFRAGHVDRCLLSFGEDFATLVTLVNRGGTSIGPLNAIEAHTIDVATGEPIGHHEAAAIARDPRAMVDSHGVHHIVWSDWSTYHYGVWRIEDPRRPESPRHLFTKYWVAGARLEELPLGPALVWWGGRENPAEGEVPLCHGADDPQPVYDTMSPALGMTFVPRQ